MNLSFEAIDALRRIVGTVSTDIFAKIPPKPDEHYRHKKKHRVKHFNNDFANDPLNGRMPAYRFVDNGNCLRIFCGSEWAYFDIRNVRVRAYESLEFTDPVLLNKEVEEVVVKTWVNNSDTKEKQTLKKTKSYSRTETQMTAMDLGIQITQSMRSKVGGGVPGIGEAEVETGLEIQTHFSHHFERSKSETTGTEETQEEHYTVPKWTKTTLLRTESVSDFERTAIATGILDASMWICSDSDFGFTVDSFVDLARIIRGGHGHDVDWHVQNYFNERHFQDYELDFTPLKMTVVDPIRYRNVASSEIERTDTPLATGD